MDGLAGRRRLGDLVETCGLITSLEEHPLGRIEDPRFHVARQVFGRSSRTRPFQIVVLAHHRLHLIATPPPCLGAGMLPPISRLAIAWTVALIQINFYVRPRWSTLELPNAQLPTEVSSSVQARRRGSGERRLRRSKNVSARRGRRPKRHRSIQRNGGDSLVTQPKPR
jgi:hypothetical protein